MNFKIWISVCCLNFWIRLDGHEPESCRNKNLTPDTFMADITQKCANHLKLSTKFAVTIFE